MNRFDYDGSFWFSAPRDEVWRKVERFDSYESWWRWLHSFRADGDELVAGNVLHGVVTPPVPYRLHVDVRLTSCAAPELVEADVEGDLCGWARLSLVDADGGTRADVAWSLVMGTAPLRFAAEVAYPVMRWGHDRVVEMAVAGFRRKALPVTAAR